MTPPPPPDDPPLVWARREWCGGQGSAAERIGGNHEVGRCIHTPHARSSSDQVERQGVMATKMGRCTEACNDLGCGEAGSGRRVGNGGGESLNDAQTGRLAGKEDLRPQLARRAMSNQPTCQDRNLPDMLDVAGSVVMLSGRR